MRLLTLLDWITEGESLFMTSTIVDLITWLLIVLLLAAAIRMMLTLERKASPQGITYRVRLLVLCICFIPLALWGGYTVARSWHYALTFAETWGPLTVALFLLGQMVIPSLRKNATRQTSKRHERLPHQ